MCDLKTKHSVLLEIKKTNKKVKKKNKIEFPFLCSLL